MFTAAPEITFARDGVDWQWRGFVSIPASGASSQPELSAI